MWGWLRVSISGVLDVWRPTCTFTQRKSVIHLPLESRKARNQDWKNVCPHPHSPTAARNLDKAGFIILYWFFYVLLPTYVLVAKSILEKYGYSSRLLGVLQLFLCTFLIKLDRAWYYAWKCSGNICTCSIYDHVKETYRTENLEKTQSWIPYTYVNSSINTLPTSYFTFFSDSFHLRVFSPTQCRVYVRVRECCVARAWQGKEGRKEGDFCWSSREHQQEQDLWAPLSLDGTLWRRGKVGEVDMANNIKWLAAVEQKGWQGCCGRQRKTVL